MKLIRGNLGRDLTFFAATNEKEALLSFSVAENRYAPPTEGPNGEKVWGEPETIWHNNVVVFGKHAERLHETLQTGDPVIVVGEHGEEQTYTDREGVERKRTPFYADHVSFDLQRTNVTVNRNPKASASAEQTQEQSQSAVMSPPEPDEPAPAAASVDEPTVHDEYLTEFSRRIDQLVATKWIREDVGGELQRQFMSTSDPATTHQQVGDLIRSRHIRPEAATYLGSVLDEYAGRGKALGFTEACQVVQNNSAPRQAPAAPAAPAQAAAGPRFS